MLPLGTPREAGEVVAGEPGNIRDVGLHDMQSLPGCAALREGQRVQEAVMLLKLRHLENEVGYALAFSLCGYMKPKT